MDRREVMLDQKGEGCSRELCREDWLEQVCGCACGGMKEVREGEPSWRRAAPRSAPLEVVCGGLCAGSGWRQDPGGVSGAPLWSKGGRCVAGPVPEEWS